MVYFAGDGAAASKGSRDHEELHGGQASAVFLEARAIGAFIVTYTILGFPYYNCRILSPKIAQNLIL